MKENEPNHQQGQFLIQCLCILKQRGAMIHENCSSVYSTFRYLFCLSVLNMWELQQVKAFLNTLFSKCSCPLYVILFFHLFWGILFLTQRENVTHKHSATCGGFSVIHHFIRNAGSGFYVKVLAGSVRSFNHTTSFDNKSLFFQTPLYISLFSCDTLISLNFLIQQTSHSVASVPVVEKCHSKHLSTKCPYNPAVSLHPPRHGSEFELKRWQA